MRALLARVMWAFGLLLGCRLAGAFVFAAPLGPVSFGDVYMTSDFAVQSSVPRLSKLVLACILSTIVDPENWTTS
ncbi:MAG: GNAT-like putative antirestriction protein [Gemmataceae bacterium]